MFLLRVLVIAIGPFDRFLNLLDVLGALSVRANLLKPKLILGRQSAHLVLLIFHVLAAVAATIHVAHSLSNVNN